MHNTNNTKAEEELYRLQAEFCKAMAHPKRIHILRILKGGEKTVGELAKITGIPQANVSQHLAILRQFGLLQTRRDGTNIYYSISDRRIVEACELVRNCIGERLKRSQMVLTVPP
ncbi:MAG TPA: metalloregulator ArsR/SmtB family transcription factor [Nitrososphaerales archaeon]|nr:metalloregulator ArsR/SmtB family transcription factor [Nitrososphaerales archaeon]